MKSRWRTVAIARVELGLMEYEAQAILLNEAIDPLKCKHWISRNKYPFVGRELHPYRIWLSECKQIPIFLGTHRPMGEYQLWRSQTFYQRSPRPSPGQLSVLDYPQNYVC